MFHPKASLTDGQQAECITGIIDAEFKI